MATQPDTRRQQLIRAAQTGALAAGAQATLVAPAVTVTAPAVAAAGVVGQAADAVWDATKIALILRLLRRFFTRKRTQDVHWLERELRKRYPAVSLATIRAAVAQEMAYEDAFQAKALQRVEADLLKVGALPTAEARAQRVKEILAREKHYVGLRQDALMARAVAACERELLRNRSPRGAKWVLGDRKNHTAGCVALAGKSWPWDVLDIIHPPVHTGCGCGLLPVTSADEVPEPGEALRMAREAMALEEAIREVADDGEIDAALAGEPVRPVIARAVERLQEAEWKPRLHPRDRLGRWSQVLGQLHTITREQVARGHVPGVALRDLAPGVAGRAEPDEIHLSPSAFDAHGHISSVLMAHEAGHYLVPLIIKDGKVPPELQAFEAGRGRPAGRYGAVAGGNALLFRNPWQADERSLPEEMLADAYASLLHGEGEFSYAPGFDGPDDPDEREKARRQFESSPKTKLLRLVAAAAREAGWPDRGLYRFERQPDGEYELRLREAADYEEMLHPRGRGGRWIKKLDGKRLELKGDKRLTSPQVHARVKAVATGLSDFYGGEPVEVHHEPDYLASVGSDARFRHTGQPLSGLLYGRRVHDMVKDPELGVEGLRMIAHEAAHSLSGTRPGPLPGFSQTVEEGAAEVLSLWFWHHKGQVMDHRDATRLQGKWTEGLDTLAHSTVYRDEVEELMRRAASKVGWDRTAIVDEVERVMRGDHTTRLRFRDQTDPHFSLPHDLPATQRALTDTRTDNAVALIRWLVGANPEAAVTEPRSAHRAEGITGEEFVHAFDGFRFKDFTLVSTRRTEAKGPYADLWLNVIRNGEKVGFVRAKLKPPTQKGLRVCEAENLWLRREHQGSGLGAAVISHLFDALRAGGVDKVRLNAVQVGSYAWARAGFTWVRDAAKEQQRIFEAVVKSGQWYTEIVPSVSEQLREEFLARIKAGDFSSEAELAAFGRHETWTDAQGRTMWLGKAVMLDSSWLGERDV